MQVAIPLEKMTTADKLRAMEEIWSNLQFSERNIPSPAWHADVLRAREGRIKNGTSKFHDWTEAKARIRKRTANEN